MILIAWVALLALGIAAVVITVHLVVSVINTFTSALPVPTPQNVVPDVIKALDLHVRSRLLEPGCGDGRVLRAALECHPRLQAAGVDNNPVTLAFAIMRLRGKGQLRWGNLMRCEFADVDRVFTYLSPKLMALLEPRLERELPAGARLVSLQFPLPGRAADMEIDLTQGLAHAKRIYVYDY